MLPHLCASAQDQIILWLPPLRRSDLVGDGDAVGIVCARRRIPLPRKRHSVPNRQHIRRFANSAGPRMIKSRRRHQTSSILWRECTRMRRSRRLARASFALSLCRPASGTARAKCARQTCIALQPVCSWTAASWRRQNSPAFKNHATVVIKEPAVSGHGFTHRDAATNR